MLNIYLDNYARYIFFKKLLGNSFKKNNVNFITDLFSTYLKLSRKKNVNVFFVITNNWQKILCNIFKIKIINSKNLLSECYSESKFIFWNGKHRNQEFFKSKINPNSQTIFIENANINNLFQFGNEGINSFHEIFKDQKNKYLTKETPDSEVIKSLNRSSPVQLDTFEGLGRERYQRQILGQFWTLFFLLQNFLSLF